MRVSTPALLTMISTRPNCATAAETRFSRSANRFVAERDDLLFQFVRRVGVGNIINHDIRTLPREFQHDRHANPTVAAGHDGYFSLKAHGFDSGLSL